MSSDIIYLDIISKSVTDLDFFYTKNVEKKPPKSIERLNQKKHKISKLSMLNKNFFFGEKERSTTVCMSRSTKVQSSLRYKIDYEGLGINEHLCIKWLYLDSSFIGTISIFVKYL